MRILITGAAGFIGSNLVMRCINAGWVVSGVDDLSNGHTEFLPPPFLYHGFIQSDFAGPEVLAAIQNDSFDAVVHLAAVPRVSYSVEHPLETNDTNVSKTLQLAQACRGHVKRFVFASSSSVYGGADVLPTQESAPKRPRSPYALQKSIIEDYLQLYDELYGDLDSACLRFFNVFGGGQLGDSPYATAVSAWLTAIKKGQSMRSDGDGTQSRDMCHVDNVTDACMRAASSPKALHARCYNVAVGGSVTNNDVLAYLLTRYPGSTFVSAPTRPGDVKHTQADVTRARDELSYVPSTRFWPGLIRTCDWYDANWDWIKDLRLKT